MWDENRTYIYIIINNLGYNLNINFTMNWLMKMSGSLFAGETEKCRRMSTIELLLPASSFQNTNFVINNDIIINFLFYFPLNFIPQWAETESVRYKNLFTLYPSYPYHPLNRHYAIQNRAYIHNIMKTITRYSRSHHHRIIYPPFIPFITLMNII